MRNTPIGIFDSGVGGLTVFRAISRFFPHEDIVYFGDTARVPYGTKSSDTIVRFATENINFLKRFNIKIIVVACNTASAILSNIKKTFNLPLIGVIEPGVKQALNISRNKRIGVIGTEGTIRSKAYQKVFHRYNPSVKIFSQACPLFVPLIEADWVRRPETKSIAKNYLSKFKDKDIDVLVLGCTHYPLLKPVIRKEMGKQVKLIDSAQAVAKDLSNLFKEKKIKIKEHGKPDYKFFVSDLPPKFKKIGERFLGKKIGKIYLQRF